MLGAKTIAMLRTFILLYCSCSTTSVIKLIAQSSSAASVRGSCFTSWVQSSSVLQCITCSGVRESSTPEGSSLNQACRSPKTCSMQFRKGGRISRVTFNLLNYEIKWNAKHVDNQWRNVCRIMSWGSRRNIKAGKTLKKQQEIDNIELYS